MVILYLTYYATFLVKCFDKVLIFVIKLKRYSKLLTKTAKFKQTERIKTRRITRTVNQYSHIQTLTSMHDCLYDSSSRPSLFTIISHSMNSICSKMVWSWEIVRKG